MTTRISLGGFKPEYTWDSGPTVGDSERPSKMLTTKKAQFTTKRGTVYGILVQSSYQAVRARGP